MKLKFKSTAPIKIFRSVEREIQDMNDNDVQEIDDKRAKWLLKDFPDNFLVVASTAEKIVDAVKDTIRSKPEPREQPTEIIEDKASIHGRRGRSKS